MIKRNLKIDFVQTKVCINTDVSWEINVEPAYGEGQRRSVRVVLRNYAGSLTTYRYLQLDNPPVVGSLDLMKLYVPNNSNPAHPYYCEMLNRDLPLNKLQAIVKTIFDASTSFEGGV